MRGARPPRFPSLFETLCRIIPYQQLSLDAGGAISNRFVERFGRAVTTSDGRFWAFSEPEDLAQAKAADFEGIGLNRHKIASLQRLATLIVSGELSAAEIESLPTQAALLRLQALPGVGPWTAALVLLRGAVGWRSFRRGMRASPAGCERSWGPRRRSKRS